MARGGENLHFLTINTGCLHYYPLVRRARASMSLNFKEHAGLLQLAFVIAVIGGAVLLSLSLAPEQAPRPPAADDRSLPVSVVMPAPLPYRPTLTLNGVVAARTVTNVTPQVSGAVVSVSDAFRPGAEVDAGEVLFVIDPRDYELSVERTLAEIEAARSELALLEAEAAAEIQVWESQSPDRPIPDLIARVPQIAAARARIRSGEAARRAAELDLQRTTVRAQFDARVLDTRLDVGQVVGAAAAVGSLYAIDALEVEVPVSSDDLALLGDVLERPASVRGTDGGEIPAAVVRRAAFLDAQTRLGTLYVETDDPAGLTVGEFVTVRIKGTQIGDAVAVPSSALTSRDQLWVVDDGRLDQRRIRVLGAGAERTITAAFDAADGVVVIPPPDGRVGLPVEAQHSPERVSADAGSEGS